MIFLIFFDGQAAIFILAKVLFTSLLFYEYRKFLNKISSYLKGTTIQFQGHWHIADNCIADNVSRTRTEQRSFTRFNRNITNVLRSLHRVIIHHPRNSPFDNYGKRSNVIILAGNVGWQKKNKLQLIFQNDPFIIKVRMFVAFNVIKSLIDLSEQTVATVTIFNKLNRRRVFPLGIVCGRPNGDFVLLCKDYRFNIIKLNLIPIALFPLKNMLFLDNGPEKLQHQTNCLLCRKTDRLKINKNKAKKIK